MIDDDPDRENLFEFKGFIQVSFFNVIWKQIREIFVIFEDYTSVRIIL